MLLLFSISPLALAPLLGWILYKSNHATLGKIQPFNVTLKLIITVTTHTLLLIVIFALLQIILRNLTISPDLQTIGQWILLALLISSSILQARKIYQSFTAELKAKGRTAHTDYDEGIKRLLLLAACIAIFISITIILTLVFEAFAFFNHISIFEFFTNPKWSPQIALRTDQAGASGQFGVLPLLLGTIIISAIAMLLAVPTGLMLAVFTTQFLSNKMRNIVKGGLEILIGIPTVVYGFFAALTLGPWLSQSLKTQGYIVSPENALVCGVVMGIMIIPFISSFADDAIDSVPKHIKDGGLAIGSTRSEVAFKILIPAAKPGIVAGFLLALSRAIGETMIVVMAAGLSAKLSLNPLEALTTMTVQIVTLLTGDQSFDSPKTLAAYAIGFTLFTLTLLLNIYALHYNKKHKVSYFS